MIHQHWVFGAHCGLDFSTPVPTPSTGYAIQTQEGCASVCDASGNLLFYTDGVTVWDSSHSPRVTGLEGHSSSTQSALIVPDPGDPDQYYIFTTDGSHNYIPPYRHFNGGLLHVGTWNFTPLASLMPLPDTSNFSPVEKLTAIPKGNCEGYWVLTVVQEGKDNNSAGGRPVVNGPGVFRVFSVDASGISHIGDEPMQEKMGEWGYLKASPDGNWLALADYQNQSILLFPFDALTGNIQIGSRIRIDTPPGAHRSPYGVEFSPDSQLLYYGIAGPKTGMGKVYQVDLQTPQTSVWVGDIPNSKGAVAIGALQVGSDQRIYIAKPGEQNLAAILDPNVPGQGCNLDPNFLTLAKGSVCQMGLPNLVMHCEKSQVPEEECNCACSGCNELAAEHNQELIERAKEKFHTETTDKACSVPFEENCERSALRDDLKLAPCFAFHWGDSPHDQIETHDTESFFLTVCNPFKDIQFNGLQITQVALLPDEQDRKHIQIIPDRLIKIGCLKACACQTREFALITRGAKPGKNYRLEVEYCYESISLSAGSGEGRVEFPLSIVQD